MANTAVSVCSNALVKLGDDPITSLNDNTNRARHCKRLFDPARQEVLRGANWNDSIKRATLAQSVTEPEWEFDYQYALPADYLRMVKTSLDIDKIKYKIEGRMLLTNEASISITYVYDNEDIASYDAAHVAALEDKLAFELANAITAKLSLRDRFEKSYEIKLANAKVVDGQEDIQDEFTDDTLVTIRY